MTDPYVGRLFYFRVYSGVATQGMVVYNPRTGMWLTRDPQADDYKEYSPYVFCAGNPVNVVDPDGLAWRTLFDENNSVKKLINKNETLSRSFCFRFDNPIKLQYYEDECSICKLH